MKSQKNYKNTIMQFKMLKDAVQIFKIVYSFKSEQKMQKKF